MKEVVDAFFAQLAILIPLLFVAITPYLIKLAIKGIQWLMAKLQPAIDAAVDEVEEEKARDPMRYTTPVSMQSAAVQKARKKAPITTSMFPDSMLSAQVDQAVVQKKVARAKSDPPPPLPARPSGELRGLDMSAIEPSGTDDSES